MNNPITVETTINATIQDVWKLWTTPEDIIQWNNPSDNWQTLKVDNDVKAGGRFLFRMQAKDGSDGFDFGGKYDKVLLNERIEYTLDDGRKTINQFIENENGITIIETFEPEAKTPLDGQRRFCQGVLNNFKKYAERSLKLIGSKIKKDIPTVETQMLIRKPTPIVFQAFIDPAITTNFWFTKSSGKLEAGKTVTWEWEMYGVATNVIVKEIIQNKKIATEWGNPVTKVDYLFKALTKDTTYVEIKNYGFNETGDKLIQLIKDSTGGFTTVLDGLKAYLEHNIKLALIADKFPKEVGQHGK